jgi:hypothetical protein
MAAEDPLQHSFHMAYCSRTGEIILQVFTEEEGRFHIPWKTGGE